MTLAEFLLARIAEDEAAARSAGREPILLPPGSITLLSHVEYMRHWHPDRVLAECEAKRRIVEDYQHEVRDYRAGYTNVQPGHKTMKLLALPYADHPDYDQEWKP